ncbi:hypothetical protein COY88_02015 [Candidatus Roizmanbacteria bacterium CG_4_10_14_0_8_um_filter_35_28]|uniref:PIN domain-containing protein n=1 Tax=Candidatus Roizmanbacteria bacterium CG_4_10_14_0_8_um_filter_35_28 TaxID=1974827 RepID=A0A2M7QGL2_9BACT|nr:MAG: hypothetical protein COY88_02015 [Candidatus Roizmanbacteria bacterium CG_4_10_14_0_8_um_filter_35_28]
MIFVDTNYFLRYFINDGSLQHQEAVSLFLAAGKGEKNLITSIIVVFEIFWILGSVYKLNKLKKISIIQDLLNMTFIKIEERNFLQKSLKIYKTTSLQIEDCYNLIYFYENKIKEMATFDKKLKKIVNKLS